VFFRFLSLSSPFSAHAADAAPAEAESERASGDVPGGRGDRLRDHLLLCSDERHSSSCLEDAHTSPAFVPPFLFFCAARAVTSN
jgi:hypothetical protein